MKVSSRELQLLNLFSNGIRFMIFGLTKLKLWLCKEHYKNLYFSYEMTKKTWKVLAESWIGICLVSSNFKVKFCST